MNVPLNYVGSLAVYIFAYKTVRTAEHAKLLSAPGPKGSHRVSGYQKKFVLHYYPHELRELVPPTPKII